jgi:predicted N-acetyltransferase YhbS
LFTPSASNVIRSLDNDLVMKYPGTPEDIERLAAFSARIHSDEHVAEATRAMLKHHPYTRPEAWPFVEDESTGEIVSALCLIPWTWRYEDVTLKAGEMGFVGTLENYRHKGLIRALDGYFKELLRDGEYDLSQIQGIPYFYRQFGYEYALPLEGGWQIRHDQIPDDLPEGFHFRQATLDDLPVLARLYDEAARDLDISTVRDRAAWRYMVEHQPHTQSAGETWLVWDSRDGTPVGYFRVARCGFGAGSVVEETSRLSQPAAMAALGKIRALSDGWEKPYIRLSASDTSPVVKVAWAWGAHSEGRYAWQIHVPDVARLMRKIAPVLERRIANSAFAGLSETVVFNMYRKAVELRFANGQIASIEAVGFRNWERHSINIPPLLVAPLVLGYRSREELHQSHPDVGIWGQSAYLIDVLFPKMKAFIYQIY